MDLYGWFIKQANERKPSVSEWHIAIHRYEIKQTVAWFSIRKTNMNEITELPEGDYKADENITNGMKNMPSSPI